ncbi:MULTISPECIES: hypothetical protein [Mycobacterium]|uniref:Uncharacterized protein n=1 Tax=Mycobacterium kyorinense TaxID=487514 RepID=A0A1X1XEN8_9MYCO|nr:MULTISPECIES: hypothetical protein [Mycobacterium]ORV97213.1 hypothetical protein AWC14_15340 [Mycobacterium kyorinense]
MADLTGRDFAKAREIFFNYDGSRFYMSRDGVEAEYESFSVPKEVENKWLEELTTHKLSMLGESGNWWVVYFLCNKRDCRHLSHLLSAEPLGAFWQRCAYLEVLLDYVGVCSQGYCASDIQAAAQYVLDHAQGLSPEEAPSEQLRQRVRRVIESAAALRSTTADE